MKLTDIVTPAAIIADLQATERNDAITELVDALIAAKAAPAKLRADLLKQILAREKNGSTGFGKGVAVPHVKHDQLKKMSAAIGVSAGGVDFNALDKAPVHSIVLLLSPKSKPDEHLQAMETIFSNLQQDTFRRFLRQSTSCEEIVDLLGEADNKQLS